jgi:hypothetical protein
VEGLSSTRRATRARSSSSSMVRPMRLFAGSASSPRERQRRLHQQQSREGQLPSALLMSRVVCGSHQ